MSQIKDYLEAGRANKVFDPNQGLFIDPDTGKTFVPTFTNVQTSNIQQQVGKAMGGGAGIQAEPYLVSDKPQAGAMPGASMPGAGQKPKGPDPRDPWAMASEHMKSPGFKMEIYREMFGDRDPSQGFQTKQERDLFRKALQSSRNLLADRFKWQIEQKRKDDELKQKNAAKNIDPKEYYKNIMESRARWKQAKDESLQGDPSGASWQQEYGDKTIDELAKEEVHNVLSDYSEFTGQSDAGAMPGREAPKEGDSAIKVDEQASMPVAKDEPDKDAYSDYEPENTERFTAQELTFKDKGNMIKLIEFVRSEAKEKGIDPDSASGKKWVKDRLQKNKFTENMAKLQNWKKYSIDFGPDRTKSEMASAAIDFGD